MAKRQVSAKEILQDIWNGLSDSELMEKRHLTETELRTVFRKLVEFKALSWSELDLRESILKKGRSLQPRADEQDRETARQGCALSDNPSNISYEALDQPSMIAVLTTGEWRDTLWNEFRQLLEQGAGLEERDADGATPLILAAKGGHKEIVDLLLKRGADYHARDSQEKTALNWANSNGYVEIAAVLLKHQAQEKGKRRAESLIEAVRTRSQSRVEKLVRQGAYLEARDADGATPLIIAAKMGCKPIFTYLRDQGADLEATDPGGLNALSWATINKHSEIINLIVEGRAPRKSKSHQEPSPSSVSKDRVSTVSTHIPTGPESNRLEEVWEQVEEDIKKLVRVLAHKHGVEYSYQSPKEKKNALPIGLNGDRSWKDARARVEIDFHRQDEASVFLECNEKGDRKKFVEILLFTIFAVRNLHDLSRAGDPGGLAHSLALFLTGVPELHTRLQAGVLPRLTRLVEYKGNHGRKRFIAKLYVTDTGIDFNLSTKGFGFFGRGIDQYSPDSVVLLLQFLERRRMTDSSFRVRLLEAAQACGNAFLSNEISLTSQNRISFLIASKVCASMFG